MKDFGRILVCGSIQTYNDIEEKKYAATNFAILVKGLSVYGFRSSDHYAKWPESFVEMNNLMKSV